MSCENILTKLGFNDMLLGAVILLMATGFAMVIGLYVLPREPLRNPEVQPTIRVTSVAGFPVGGSRVTTWGERIIMVVRSDVDRYSALQGVSPSDGCILRWQAISSRLTSPCSYVVYDLQGNVVTGVSLAPLRRYSTFVRGGFVYVTE